MTRNFVRVIRTRIRQRMRKMWNSTLTRDQLRRIWSQMMLMILRFSFLLDLNLYFDVMFMLDVRFDVTFMLDIVYVTF